MAHPVTTSELERCNMSSGATWQPRLGGTVVIELGYVGSVYAVVLSTTFQYNLGS
jgi:hypothetical protein